MSGIKYIADAAHYKDVLSRVASVKSSLWIGTADIKDLYVDAGAGQVPFLGELSRLIGHGVNVRLIHAKEPGPVFREEFDRYPLLATRLERALCPRVHFKIMVFDCKVAYVGSANLTGAGIGMKGQARCNFEAGILTDEPSLVTSTMAHFDGVWAGLRCKGCGLRKFMRAMIDTLKVKRDGSEETEDLIEDLVAYFIRRKSVIKLRPVEYDRSYFDSVIVDGNDSFPSVSKSQECMKGAKIYFTGKLKDRSLEELKKFCKVVLSSNFNRIELSGKMESALMFELQNNRGRELTNLEKLKSYFMYQMYVCSSPEETDANVESISDFFKDIYTTVHDIRGIEEDSLLIYHCQAYLRKAFGYRNLEDIKSELESSDDKVRWIKEFSRELTCTFKNMKELQVSKAPYYLKLKSMGVPAFVYPFIIKGMHFFREDGAKMDALCHVLEILSFRYYLIGSRADINGRLTDSLRKFDGDVIKLRDSLKRMANDNWYWSDSRMKDYLEGYMYDNHVLRYVLWQYEDSLQRTGYNVISCEVSNEQIEHISPQIPPAGEALAAGYDVDENNAYSDGFKENELNSIGNLMLISGSHNASIGNRTFCEKLQTYEENPVLRQQAEISAFLTGGKPEWKAEQIDRRREKIVSFAEKRWDFDSVQ